MQADILKRVKAHGRNLLAIFPNAKEKNPVKLCRKLRRLEAEAGYAAVDFCNGEIDTDGWERISSDIRARVQVLLNSVRPWINGDPRGYALKINLDRDEVLYRDMGGYGILAPDLTEG